MPQPTRRPTDAAFEDPGEGTAVPTSLLNLPWIDPHNHAHTLSWADRERFALTGCRGMVTVAAGYHWTPYRPVHSDDVRHGWDAAIGRRRAIERAHGFDVGLAVGVHTGVRVEDADALLEAMPGYLDLDEVVAVGETGVTLAQRSVAWDLDGQREVVRGQMALAAEHDLPVVLHTPAATDETAGTDGARTPSPGFERPLGLRQPPVLSGPDAALDAVRLDVEAADEAGLSHEQVLASHAGPGTVEYLLEETGFNVGFTVGSPWLHGITPADVAAAVRAHGPDRVLMETDAANVLRSDVRSVKRGMFELHRLGVDEDAIRRVVLDNPRDLFGLGG